MYADDYGPKVSAQAPMSRPSAPVSVCVEERYRKAKARLAAAQQEKLEAAFEFMAARAALSRRMEEIWPGQEE